MYVNNVTVRENVVSRGMKRQRDNSRQVVARRSSVPFAILRFRLGNPGSPFIPPLMSCKGEPVPSTASSRLIRFAEVQMAASCLYYRDCGFNAKLPSFTRWSRASFVESRTSRLSSFLFILTLVIR